MPAANPGSGFTIMPGFIGMGTDRAIQNVGGAAYIMKAAAALNVGDAVYISAADTVDKGATAQLGQRGGVVVGGQRTGFRTQPEVKTGAAAANAAGELVLVAFQNAVVTAVSDAAIAVGNPISFAGTAGRVIAAAAGAALNAGVRNNILGTALSATGGAAVDVRVLIGAS